MSQGPQKALRTPRRDTWTTSLPQTLTLILTMRITSLLVAIRFPSHKIYRGGLTKNGEEEQTLVLTWQGIARMDAGVVEGGAKWRQNRAQGPPKKEPSQKHTLC